MPRSRGRALRGVARLLRVEGQLTRVVRGATRAWLYAVRDAVLPGHGIPDPAAGGHAAQVWEQHVEDDIVPVLTSAFGAEFQQVAGPSEVPHAAYMEDYLHDARSRLRDFPASAWDDLQPEIAEAFRSGEDNRQIAERIGWILDFDAAGGDGSQARSRELQAEIADVDRQLREGTLTPAQEAQLRGQRSADYELLHETDRRWQYRADRIARTEAQAVQNGGALAAARARAQQFGDQMFKQWMATGDTRTRHTHRVAGGLEDEAGIATPGGRGQIVPAAAPFHVGGALLQFPADPAGPPGETINCRCTLTFLDQGEAMDSGYDPRSLSGPQLAALTAADAPPDDAAAEDDGPSGAIIALLPANPDSLTVPGGDPAEQLHCTVLYLTDDATSLPDEAYDFIAQTLAGGVPLSSPITAKVTGVDTLGDDDPPATVMHLDGGDQLAGLRDAARSAVGEDVQVPEDTYPDYTPHLTLGYGTDPAAHQDRVGQSVTFDRIALMRAGQVTAFPLGGTDMPDAPPAPAESMTAAAPLAPPKDWFNNPSLDGPTPLRVEPDGRVYGHLAAWGVEHASFPGQNVTAPRSNTGYAHFHVGDVLTQEGDLVPVGRLTLGTGHADPGLGLRAAAEHYDHTGACVAIVRAGEDRHGIWVAGSLVASATDEQAAELRRSPLSGDWRRAGGNLELVAALAVNVPGFAIPRPQLGLVAGGQQEMSLCAAGVIPRQDNAPVVDVAAIARAVVVEQRAQDRREQLVASLTTRVGLDPASRLAAVTARIDGMR